MCYLLYPTPFSFFLHLFLSMVLDVFLLCLLYLSLSLFLSLRSLLVFSLSLFRFLSLSVSLSLSLSSSLYLYIFVVVIVFTFVVIHICHLSHPCHLSHIVGPYADSRGGKGYIQGRSPRRQRRHQRWLRHRARPDSREGTPAPVRLRRGQASARHHPCELAAGQDVRGHGAWDHTLTSEPDSRCPRTALQIRCGGPFDFAATVCVGAARIDGVRLRRHCVTCTVCRRAAPGATSWDRTQSRGEVRVS